MRAFHVLKYVSTLFMSAGLSATAFAQDFQGVKNINGVDLYVKTMGSGPPIIFLHGGPGLNHAYFLPQVSELARTHTIIFFDQRASGRSAMVQDSALMTLDKMTEDIEGVRKAFTTDQVILIAHSWGGLLAMKYAAKYPQHLRSLILVSSVSPKAHEFEGETLKTIQSRMTKGDSVARAAIIASDAFKSGKGRAFEDILKLSFKASFHNKNLVDSLNLGIDDDFATKRRALFLLSKDLREYDFYPALRRTNLRVLIIHGDSDAVPVALAQKMQAATPNSRLVIIKNAGHFPFVEQSREFVGVVLEFIER